MKIAIVGFGVEGKALAQYFEKQEQHVTICDAKKNLPRTSGLHFQLGHNYLKGLDSFDLIFRSPGIPFLKKEFDPVRKKLTSLTKYFFEKCPCPIVGVTGTKGKGTTSTLLFEMLKGSHAGAVFLGGNIGEPPLHFLDKLKPEDIIVLELSSFQLQDLGVSPHCAVVLGITPDHLDHHQNMKEYVEAKKNIVRFQKPGDTAVLDFDNAHSASFAKSTAARVRGISVEKTVDDGGFLKVGSLVIAGGHKGIIFGEQGATGLIGDHNIKNILAAAVAADSLGVPVEVISRVVRDFKGLPHRLEFVKEINGVKFYNDSASTNPETAIAALRAFSGPIILIAGGSDKNTDFSPLGKEAAKRLNLKTVVLMGETKEKLSDAIEDAVADEEDRIANKMEKNGIHPIPQREVPLELIAAESYQEAFMVTAVMAQPGDTVLFSPACASFDMFSNYKERGDTFRNFVLSLGE